MEMKHSFAALAALREYYRTFDRDLALGAYFGASQSRLEAFDAAANCIPEAVLDSLIKGLETAGSAYHSALGAEFSRLGMEDAGHALLCNTQAWLRRIKSRNGSLPGALLPALEAELTALAPQTR